MLTSLLLSSEANVGEANELFTAGTDTSSRTDKKCKIHDQSPPRTRDRNLPKFPKRIPSASATIPSSLCQRNSEAVPPAPFLLPHRAFASCEVINYTIPKDAQVIVNVWAIGKDPMIWDDPLHFKPERFLNSTLDYKGNDYEFFPFGAGRRICPGLPMAAKHLPLVLASLIHFSDWSLPDEIDPNELDMSEKFGVTLEMEQPLLFIPKVRK
ncbi:hypothetical protein Vadar_006487 [Vaccinium darrowii]|uniref:Uncharacterized protein n=1 Tax=Vaccinium darrowii TaxID=229202 RepID=A0ACB7ZAT7_9ERIC|nr:hypothetical protein Vadar_006487 [Vaccinium darrowii]